jgi:cellulose synthase operon protein C
LKSFHSSSPRLLPILAGAAIVLVAMGWAFTASGSLPSWIRNIEAGTSIEAAFFRSMPMPGGAVLFRRPPSETRPALGDLIKMEPKNSELYSLRALEDERQLDFAAAESDWKVYVENAMDKRGAQIALADFYDRRLRRSDEINALSAVAAAPANASESLTPLAEQSSWRAFERIFGVIRTQGLPKEVSIEEYRAWVARYPHEPSLYARFLEFLISEKEYAAAGQLIGDYHKQFPGDEIFPVKARALVEYRQGSLQQGLAVYEQSFQPLWAPELVKSYFDLLAQTQSLRKFLDQARAALNTNPQDLNAAARIFYYYQQQGKLDAAQQVITEFRLHREASKSSWSAQDLYVCARLLEEIHSYPESARYYFALYNSRGMNNAQERSLAGLASLLLTAPEAPIRLGSGELSMYRDIATMDPGPGYLNGILSLILNTTSPPTEYSEEEQRAVPYFHRSRAAELLALLDEKYPNSPERPELHAKLLDFYALSGESEAVIKGGREFLAAFPHASERTQVALLMADAYARTGKTQDEFVIYYSVLQELATKADKVPLGTSAPNNPQYSTGMQSDSEQSEGNQEGEESGAIETQHSSRQGASEAFEVGTTPAQIQAGARSPEYARILERYLARLVALKQVPAALAVLRREIDRNPDDPGLYERLAVFLDQNRLGAEQEEIYRRAMARFADRSWYHKLARFYLRYKRNEEFERLTQEAIKTFSGTDLENYFRDTAYGGGPMLYLRLNEYAHRRFPHNPMFVENLLSAYHSPQTYDNAAWESLLRQHWFEEPNLRDRFFEYLSWSGKLEFELSALRPEATAAGKDEWEEFVRKNPAAGSFLAQADLWRSHFEESAPVLEALAEEYPADQELGRTASSVYRSLAYFDPAKTAVAAKVEGSLLQANPGDTEILARIGDIYADRDLLAQAAPYWERIPRVAPGQAGGYLEAATIYWDYYDFGNALRLLGEGRKKLNDDNLFSYEAGAIYENQRDYPRAIEEYIKGALASGGESPAGSRLLELARRPKFRDLVNDDTAKAAAPPNPSAPALNLRAAVLEAQGRKPELEIYLDSIIQSTTSLEQAEDIEVLAQQKSLEAVRQHSLERQAVLATDPIRRLQLRYALVTLYESRKDFQSAQRNIEALYRENPKILGVVRSTVDFYWRMKMHPQAISVLSQAAKDAYPDLSKQFTFEAARKSTEAGQYQQARDLVASLMKDAPYDSQYLAAMADTFAQAGDDRGLQQFYLEKIALFRSASLSQDERKTIIATLRRGLIPALTRMKDYSGAVNQYIELINNFPEDGELVTEAALYALRYQRQPQLTDFYSKTIAQSPRDFRWPMVLARIQTSLEEFPAAIDTYQESIAIRPDRVDLRLARAGLEERLMRFDEAVTDYERVYQLAYKDPQWMEKIAEVRARQGRADDVVAALKTALIEGRPENANKYFEVARRLESWGMLAQARVFAERGVGAAGTELLAAPEQHEGAKLYARIMTRLRQHEKAYAILESAMSSATSSLPVIKEQLAKEGVEAVTDSEWRQRAQQMRIEAARGGMRDTLGEMGGTVARYFTPEEKAAFAQFVQSKRAGMSSSDVEAFAVPLAQNADLADLEARWEYDLMMESGANPAVLVGRMNALVGLQRRRLKFAELAVQLETFAPRLVAYQRGTAWLAAAEAYRSAGDSENELRVLEEVPDNNLGQDQHNRLFRLLLSRKPQELVNRASVWNIWGESAAEYVVAHSDPSLAHAVVAARGRARPPVWLSAYNGLVGLYFSEPSPEVNSAFLGALGDNTIAERLAKPMDRTQQLAGDIWFYYGSRYGEYLGVTKQGNPGDFLPAELEQSPASASGYLTLADYYASSGDTRAAIADYNHTLELTPGRPDVHDRLAIAYYKQGQRAEAVAQWKQVFATLSRQVESVRVPESFWNDFANSSDHLHTRNLFTDLRPDADAVLRAYLRRNGNYRSNVLLHNAYVAASGPAAATAWLLDLASVAHEPTAVLSEVVEAPWIPLAQRAPIYQRILEASQNAALKAEGLEKESAQSDLRSWQVRWVKYLVQMMQYAQAGDAIAALPQETRDAEAAQLVPLELQLAAQLGTLESKIAGYRSEPQTAPASELLRTAARQIFELGDKQSARKLLEFVFAREIDEHKLIAANFLGLAEIRIAAGDTPGAMDLLRRLVVVVGNPYENLEPAAALLEKTGHNTEAIEFLEQLVKSNPWEPAYRLRLAKATIAAGKDAASATDVLAAIASSGDVPYSLRVETGAALAGARPEAKLGSGELDLLAGDDSRISIVAADQPFYYDARLRAAQTKIDAQRELQLLASALADTPTREDARIPLFETAAVLQADEYAMAVLEPLLRQRSMLVQAEPPGDEEQEIINSDGEENAEEEATPSLYTSARLLPAQQAQIAWEAGNVMVRLDRLNEALPYLQLAGKLDKASARHKEIVSKIVEVKSSLQRQKLNAARQPILHIPLEQDRVVRPRLVARPLPRPNPATKGGVMP